MTPDSVKLWINTVLRAHVQKACANPETLDMIQIGKDRGDPLERIIAAIVSSVVLEIAGMSAEEWK